MKKINVFYGIIFKRVMLELSGLCCCSTYDLEAFFLRLMSYGNLFEKDAPPIEPIARAGMSAISLARGLNAPRIKPPWASGAWPQRTIPPRLRRYAY